MSDPKMEPAAAVLKAGYKTKNPHQMATQLMQNPLIKREIDKMVDERRERIGLSTDYVIGKLMQIVEDTEKGNPQAALRGLELLGKNLGLFKERQEISGPDGKAIEYEQKVKTDVNDFTRKLKELASRNPGSDAGSGTGEVVEFSKRRGQG